VDRPALFTRDFVRLLLTVTTFGLSWSSYLILPKFLVSELGAERAEIGWIVAIPGIAATVGAPFVGSVLDRYGRKPFMILGSAIVTATSVGFLAVDRVGPYLVLMQAVQGVGFLLAFNAASALASDLAPSARMAEAMGIFGAANLIMNAVAPSIAEELAAMFSWQVVFAFCAIVGLLATSMATRLPVGAGGDGSAARAPMRSVLSVPLTTAYFGTVSFAFSFATLFNFHQPFALESGVEVVKPFFIGYTATAIFVRVVFGKFTDRLGPFRIAVVSMAGYAAVPAGLLYFGPSLLWVTGALLGVTHGMLYPAMAAVIVVRAPASVRATALTFLNGAFHLGMALAGLGSGAISQRYGFPPTFLFASLVTAFGLVVFVFGRARSPVTQTAVS
jgi:MFS family permease